MRSLQKPTVHIPRPVQAPVSSIARAPVAATSAAAPAEMAVASRATRMLLDDLAIPDVDIESVQDKNDPAQVGRHAAWLDHTPTVA